MTGLSTSIVAYKLPTNPTCPPVKQKLRKFKPDMSLKIKEEVTKQVKAKILVVVEYPTWLANIIPVPKKDGKVRVCVDYRDLNRASLKDKFPLSNAHILIDNCAKHELQSFVIAQLVIIRSGWMKKMLRKRLPLYRGECTVTRRCHLA
ncbi:uncharacterized protein [Nicotiana sylvestris]|uniref:uncharacterized protein n=1 Tax=Nicotiana sylvestris TaxID=4096 RepID=UPI00388C3E14